MTKDTVEILVSVVLEVYCVSKYLKWALQKREPEVVRVNVGQCCTESWLYHVSYNDEHSNKRLVGKSLDSFAEPKLYLVAMLKQEVADGREILYSHINHCLKVDCRLAL